MQRSIFYPASQWRGFDVVSGALDVLEEIAATMGDAMGASGPLVIGCAPLAANPPNMTVAMSPGAVWQSVATDPEAAGSIAQQPAAFFQRGYALTESVLAMPAVALAEGYSVYFLIYANVEVADSVRPGDPTGGLLSFWNSAAPVNPLTGIAGTAQTLPTMRAAVAQFTVVAGVPATTGQAAVPPCPQGGVPVAVVVQNYGDTALSQGALSYSPLCPLLAGALNAHHGGVPGQAPKINLASEVQGILPATALPFVNQVVDYTSGTWTCPAGVKVVRVKMWGGGGRGGNGNGGAGGGGAGGAYCERLYPVHAGQVYAYEIGAGGTVNSGATTTVFDNAIFAGPGGPGASGPSGGGSISFGLGTGAPITFSGQSGSNGLSAGGVNYSGAGGSSFGFEGGIAVTLTASANQNGGVGQAGCGGSGGVGSGVGGDGCGGLVIFEY